MKLFYCRSLLLNTHCCILFAFYSTSPFILFLVSSHNHPLFSLFSTQQHPPFSLPSGQNHPPSSLLSSKYHPPFHLFSDHFFVLCTTPRPFILFDPCSKQPSIFFDFCSKLPSILFSAQNHPSFSLFSTQHHPPFFGSLLRTTLHYLLCFLLKTTPFILFALCSMLSSFIITFYLTPPFISFFGSTAVHGKIFLVTNISKNL